MSIESYMNPFILLVGTMPVTGELFEKGFAVAFLAFLVWSTMQTSKEKTRQDKAKEVQLKDIIETHKEERRLLNDKYTDLVERIIEMKEGE